VCRLKPLQASPEIQVVTRNPARTFFAGPAPHLSEPLQQAIIISDTQPKIAPEPQKISLRPRIASGG